jgi:hypothetical protein
MKDKITRVALLATDWLHVFLSILAFVSAIRDQYEMDEEHKAQFTPAMDENKTT